MQLTNALFATVCLLGLASASPKAHIRSLAPLTPLERRGIDCTQDDDHAKCVCDACEETEDFQVGTRKSGS